MCIRAYLRAHAVSFEGLLHRPAHSATRLGQSVHGPGGAPTGARACLRAHAVSFEVLLHRPAHSATRLAQSVHVPGQRVAKVVLLRAGEGFVVAGLPATHRIDLGRLPEVLKTRDVRLATEDEV